MAILRNSPWQKPKIDLAGPQGNAYVLLGLASRFSRELGLDADAILAEMRSGDYEHLIQVFDRHFGAYVDLVRAS